MNRSTFLPDDTSQRRFAMGLTYFKRFRMEIDVHRVEPVEPPLPKGYGWIPWESELLPAHAEVKYQSFRAELDANVFPSLGGFDGCIRLMQEITRKDGFLPAATWLITHNDGNAEFCGTIQGIRDRTGMGSIQNVGIMPDHRGQGLGGCLLLKSLLGFRRSGVRRVYLEVTAQNEGAIRLYRRLGFCKVRTVYKAVEVTPFALR